MDVPRPIDTREVTVMTSISETPSKNIFLDDGISKWTSPAKKGSTHASVTLIFKSVFLTRVRFDVNGPINKIVYNLGPDTEVTNYTWLLLKVLLIKAK